VLCLNVAQILEELDGEVVANPLGRGRGLELASSAAESEAFIFLAIPPGSSSWNRACNRHKRQGDQWCSRGHQS
jgi:hypothetical protein